MQYELCQDKLFIILSPQAIYYFVASMFIISTRKKSLVGEIQCLTAKENPASHKGGLAHGKRVLW
jgi:hypothetical protein